MALRSRISQRYRGLRTTVMPAGSHSPGRMQGLVSKASLSDREIIKTFAGCFGVPAAPPPSTPNLAEQSAAASLAVPEGLVAQRRVPRTRWGRYRRCTGRAETSCRDPLLQSGRPRIVP